MMTAADEAEKRGVGACDRAGFSLVEVALALLLVGMGLFALFSLFPAGLRENEQAMADTKIGMFAESVMSGFRANALQVTNWAVWTDAVAFSNAVLGDNLVVDGTKIYGGGTNVFGGDIRYTLSITVDGLLDSAVFTNVPRPYLQGATLEVGWKELAKQWFYSEVFYAGAVR